MRTETAMDSDAEGDVGIGPAVEADMERVVEHCGVYVGGSESELEYGALGDPLPGQLGMGCYEARGVGNG